MPTDTTSCSSAPNNFDNSGNNKIIKFLKKPDRVLVAFLFLCAVTYLTLPAQLSDALGFVAENLISISIYLAISVGLAAYIKASGADRLVGAAFRANAGKAILIASFVGALSPSVPAASFP